MLAAAATSLGAGRFGRHCRFPAAQLFLGAFELANPGLRCETALLDFTQPFELGAGFEFRVRIENLLGASYEEIANFPAAGRSLTIGLRVATLRR